MSGRPIEPMCQIFHWNATLYFANKSKATWEYKRKDPFYIPYWQSPLNSKPYGMNRRPKANNNLELALTLI